MNSASELWYVQLSDGDVHRVTLDQLDEGFQAGHIGPNTMVLPGGATHWTKLGELAGIDDVASAPAPRAVAQPLVAPPVVARSVLARPVAPSVAPPVFAPPVLSTSLPPPPRFLESHRPVSVDLSDLGGVPGLPRRTRKRWGMALLGVAMMGGIAGVGVERPALLRVFMSDMGARASAAKHWFLTDVSRRVFGKQPAALPEPPTTAAGSESFPLATTATPPPAPTALPTAQSAVLGALPTAPEADTSRSGTKPPARGAAPKGRARKTHGKAPPSSEASTKPASTFTAAPSTFTSTGNKFDPLGSTIQ